MKFDSVGKVERMEWGGARAGAGVHPQWDRGLEQCTLVPPPPRMAPLAQPDNSGLSTA